MSSINELLWDSVTLQSRLIVTRYDKTNEIDTLLYDGEAESVGGEDGEWLDAPITFIYADPKVADTLHIEIEMEEE